jgi:hypothetical protein
MGKKSLSGRARVLVAGRARGGGDRATDLGAKDGGSEMHFQASSAVRGNSLNVPRCKPVSCFL